MDEVHRPGLVRSRGRPTVVAQFGLDPTLGRFVAQLQAQFAIDPACLLLVDDPAFTPKQDMDPEVAVAEARPKNQSIWSCLFPV